MYKRILFLILIGISAGGLLAQQRTSGAAKAISSSITGSAKRYYANRNDPPRAIEFDEETVSSSEFLGNINAYFNIPREFTFEEAEINTDHLGMRHRLLQQYYKGIPIEGMGYRVHEKNGFITSANGKAVRDINLDPKVILSEEQAFHLALGYLDTKDTVFREGKKLIVSKDFTFAPGSFSVAFQFDIHVSFIESWRISIDARDGRMINKVTLVNTCSSKEKPQPLPYGTGNGLTNYYGDKTIRVETFENGSTRLVGETAHGGKIGTYDFQNVNVLSLLLFFQYHKVYDISSSSSTYNSIRHRPAVSTQWAAEQAYEYYFTKHNRNSFDNQGSQIKCYVHVGEDLNNAFWVNNVLAFGDGTNNNPLVELDVVAHELTHGVTQYEANLQYTYEPGALNESFSDIFGKAVEFHTFGDTATWLVAKHYREGGMRDFTNPNLKDQPDTYAGDMWYTGHEDYGGVHYNSGVQNHWFYLLCEGGSGVNDHQISYTVDPIGMEQATNIAYRNLTEYLSRFSDYLDSRIGSLLATADLYGKNSIAYQEVANAWDAVGVIDEPIITSLELYDITATTVKIKGSLQPRGDTVTYHFEYGTTPEFGSSSPIYTYTNTVEGVLTGLQSETRYYLRLVATNENGNSYANTEFTTISLAPLVKIKQTVDVTETTATLHARVNPNSLPTSFYFEYGQTPDLGLVTPTYPMPDTTEYLNVSAAVSDLQPRQTYYYRLVASNDFASSQSASVSFFTAVKPVISAYSPVTAGVGEEITITGHNFNSTPEKNFVSFGAMRASVRSSTPTEITVEVPGGASLGPISVLDTESGLTSASVREFVPTFAAEFTKNDLQFRVGLKDVATWQPMIQDMDGDSRPDIVGGTSTGFMVYQNATQGGDITAESFIRNIFPAEFNGQIWIADFDGNGLQDVIGRYSAGFRIYPNLSVPGYIFFGTPVDVAVENYGYFSFKDFDQDGHIDIATIRNLSGDSSMLRIIRNQNPHGTLSGDNFEVRYTKILPHPGYDLYDDDLNNDGTPDLTYATRDRPYVTILQNHSHPGVFDFEHIIVDDTTRSRFVRYLTQDLNQDGWKDIASHSPYDNLNLAVMENRETSPGIALENPVVIFDGFDDLRIVQLGDMNGDGKVDLLVGLNNGKFVFLKNLTATGENFSASSFENFGTFASTGTTASYQQSITTGDLNGDGRPEVITTNGYNRFPYDGYQMEIWQNAPADCPDPSLITLNVSNNKVTLELPPNTTFDQFQVEYRIPGYSSWNKVYSTTMNVQSGKTYELRMRAKCYLGFTAYHERSFKTDCVDTNSFSIGTVGINSVTFQAYNLAYLEVQYSIAGKEEWSTLAQNTSQASDLSPGTTYDVRFRGRCYTPADYSYKQFTTACPELSTLTVRDVEYNRAEVGWTSNHSGDVILEYSEDNANWVMIDETGSMYPLAPVTQYFVRGKMACTDIDSDFVYASFTTPCPKVPLTVDNVTPFAARVQWIGAYGGDNYTLTYSMTAGGTVTTVETSNTSFSLDGLSPGTEYTVAVAPECVSARAFTSLTFSTVCYVPFDLSVDAITHTTADLSWSDHFSGQPYAVDYSISGSNVWLTKEVTSTNVSLADLRPGTAYEVRVHINCLSETAAYVSARFETSVYEQTTFAPNPTDSKITIYPSKNLIGNRFSIRDNAGRTIADGELIDYTIDLSGILPGIYTLQIQGEKIIKIFKH